MHLVDTTLFFSPTSGGVKRYLNAKHDWLHAHTAHRHSMLVPAPKRKASNTWLTRVTIRLTPVSTVTMDTFLRIKVEPFLCR